MDNSRLILKEKNINKVILILAWPMIAAFLLQTSFNIVDGIFVGMISAEALAAVSISLPIFILFISLAAGIGVGATSLIARCIGSKDFKKADNVAEHSVLVAIILSLIVSVLGLVFGKSLFSLISDDPALMPLVLEYANPLFIGNIFMFLAFMANHILRGEGEMKVPMYAMAGSAVLNIILDPLFIFTFGWGVSGAAWATVLSRALGCTVAFYYILKGYSSIKLNILDFKFNFSIVKEIFVLGIPSSLSQLIGSLSLFFLTGLIATFGSDAIAAFGVVFRLENLMFMPLLGLMTAMVTLVGQNVGAGKIKRARHAVFNACSIAVVFGIFIGMIYIIFSVPLASLFSSKFEVVNYSVRFFLINAWTYPFVGVIMVLLGSFLGAGKPVAPMIINLLRLLIITVPLAYIFSKTWGVIGIWWSFVIATMISFVVAVLWFWLADLRVNKNDKIKGQYLENSI